MTKKGIFFYEIKNLDNYYVDLTDKQLTNIINSTLYYYVKNAIMYKWLFYIFSFLSIGLNASIPVINQINWEHSSLFVSIISGCTAVITGMLALLCIKDSWHRYRISAEMLKTECNHFKAKIGQYSNVENKTDVFIENFEKINSDERQKWRYEKELNITKSDS